MSPTKIHTLPATGVKGLVENWKNDLIAALSTSLVALPLALGIAMASGVPPISGLISAIIGGIVTTFIRGGYVSINGPANSLIAIVIVSAEALRESGESGFQFILAAFVVSGALQVLFGLLKLGKLGDFFPASVISGMLAAIGVIILGKQIHVALGSDIATGSALDALIRIPLSIINLNPVVALIAVISLLILLYHRKIKSKFIHFIPAPVWVLLFAFPLVYLFNFFEAHIITIPFLQKTIEIGPSYLINLPGDLAGSIIFPDFSKINEPVFWIAVLSINLITTIETLISAKAVDKLDPFDRKTNLNKDLIGVGASTLVAGFIGGLPITTVIVRSSVNINHGAKTKWSNFFHGVLLLLFLLLLSPVIQEIPQAALAAILVFTGYKLTSPIVFQDALRKGKEQLFILVATLIITLLTGLIWGILAGIVLTLIVHIVVSGVPVPFFIKYTFKPFVQVIHEKGKNYYVKVKGVANFFNIFKLIKSLEKIPSGEHVIVDFSHTRFVDYTVLEFIHNYEDKYESQNGQLAIIGLGMHHTTSDHPFALHFLNARKGFKKKERRLTKRQAVLKRWAVLHNWQFNSGIEWNTENLKNFLFFETRPIEFKRNVIRGAYPDMNITWEISDITFDEGALLAKEEYHTTIQIINLPFVIPEFSLEKEVFFDKLMELAGYEDVDFKMFTDFSKKFLLKGHDKRSIQKFFTPELISFFEEGAIYHLESKGNALLIFKYLRLASPKEIVRMIGYSEKLMHQLHPDSPEEDPVKFKPGFNF